MLLWLEAARTLRTILHVNLTGVTSEYMELSAIMIAGKIRRHVADQVGGFAPCNQH